MMVDSGRSGSATPREQPLDAEKVHRIFGANASFSSNTSDFDDKAMATIRRIDQMPRYAVELHNELLRMEPQHIPEGDRLFLADDWSLYLRNTSPNGLWKPHGPAFGFGIGHRKFGYSGFKQSYVYRNHKTNWIMNIYSMIDGNSIKIDNINLCHVFQSDGNYDPHPQHVPDWFDFDQTELNSKASKLETLLEDPNAFRDVDEYDENLGADPTRIANGRSGKRSSVWEHFTEIRVLGPDGVVELTLVICHRCSIAYKTGSKTDSGFKYNGTKTLKDHSRKCSGQKHIAGNPQRAAAGESLSKGA